MTRRRVTARLNPASLGSLHPGAVSSYGRHGPRTVVHLGVGAFMRAHLATYADDLLRTGHPGLIHGVSLRSDRAERMLAPQAGLFTVNVREPGAPRPPVVVGSIAEVSTGAGAAVAAIASPDTTMVTLTVTEKGYAPSGGCHEGVAPATAATVIARGLAARDRRLAPPVFAPLDNLSGNGEVLRRAVLDAVEEIDGNLRAWISDEVRFASSVVDRMVPATTPADLDEVEAALGLRDDAAVICEEHRSWVITRVDGLPPLEAVGVEVVDDIEVHERRKLRLLNGPHSAVAYAGLVTGCSTIAAATAHPLVAPFAARISAAAVEVVEDAGRADARTFAEDALLRFANPSLGHTCVQVGADGSEKLTQRILPVVELRSRRGLDVGDHALLYACWLAAASGVEVRGTTLPRPDDPLGSELRDALIDGGIEALVERGLRAHDVPGFADLVDRALHRLRDTGEAVLEPDR